MDTNAFSLCLSNMGISTGNSAYLEGVYSPSSGVVGATGYLYNQIYTPASHIQNGNLYAPVFPLVNIFNNSVVNNTFSGQNGYRVGYQHSGNFGILIDIEYSGCTRSNSIGKGNVLLSTVDSPEQLNSGFSICINDTNRIYFKNANKSYALSKELGIRDLVYVSLTENQFVTMGLYKWNESKFYNVDIALDNKLPETNSIYFGNFLTNTSPSEYYGFEGKINQILLFNDDLSDSDVSTCSICSLVTGYNKYANLTPFSGYRITGFSFSGQQFNVVTGTSLATGKVYKNDTSFVNLVYPSGMTGLVSSGEYAIPLFQQVALQSSGDAYSFYYDQNAINLLTAFNMELDLTLTSGDLVEVYTYQFPNTNIAKSITNFQWPNETGFVQLYGNGLSETYNVDYTVKHNNIESYYSDDVLFYDVLNSGSIVTAYSGYWNNEKILMSGGSYFPSAAQYLENLSYSGQVKITGLDKICSNNPYYPSFGYDLHLNGQKLLSGIQYGITATGSNGFVVSLSGCNLPQLYVDLLYSPTGGLPTGVSNVDDNELSFIPQYTGFRGTQFVINSNTKKIGVITGCSEQVWVNGIRQRLNVDYFKHGICDEIPDNIYLDNLTFTVYNSQLNKNYWNF